MSFTTYTPAFSDDITTIPAAFLNQIRVDMGRAVDGTNGGTYTPAAALIIGGSGLQMSGTSKLLLASRSLTRVQTSFMTDGTTVSSTGTALVPPGSTWNQSIIIPNGATVTAITAYINPADDALPTTNATMRFIKVNVTTGASTTISTTTDPNTGAAYQAHHGFGPTGLTEVIDRTTNRYYVSMDGEAGGDTDSFNWFGTAVIYTITSQDDGY